LNNINLFLSSVLVNLQLEVTTRLDNQDGWNEVWNLLDYQPVDYSLSMLNYQTQYFRGSGWIVEEFHLIFLHNKEPVSIWPFVIGKPSLSEDWETINNGIFNPLFIPNLQPSIINKITKSICIYLSNIKSIFKKNSFICQIPITPSISKFEQGASFFYKNLINLFPVYNILHENFIDLRLPYEEIRKSFRKSYKSLINSGLKHWKTNIHIASEDFNLIWQEFKTLHLNVAGRSTRSDLTWETQYNLILNNEGFLVCLRDPKSDELVGAGFFQFTRDECYYSVAAYNRELFDKPLGHVVQHIAINHMINLGISWYRIGEHLFHHNEPTPSTKEMNISNFKDGFSTHLFQRFRFLIC